MTRNTSDRTGKSPRRAGKNRVRTSARRKPARKRQEPRAKSDHQVAAEGVTKADAGAIGEAAFAGASDGIPPRWRLIQRTIYALIEEGKVPTQANLAKALRVSRQTIWKFFVRHPGFVSWLDDEMSTENGHLMAPLVRRHAMLGMAGSVASAEFVAKVLGGYFGRRIAGSRDGSEEEDGLLEDTRYIVNILVPHPELPNGGMMPQLSPAPPSGMPPLKDIPMVNVR